MTCEDCDTAAARLWHGMTATCRGCWARSVSRDHAFARVMAAGWLDRPYLDLCGRFGVTHNEVKKAAEADALHRNMELPLGGKD